MCVVQKASFFKCLLDVAAGLGPGSRTGSLSHEGPAPTPADPHLDDPHTLADLARQRNTRQSLKNSKKVLELQGSHHGSMESLDEARLQPPHSAYQNGHHGRSSSLSVVDEEIDLKIIVVTNDGRRVRGDEATMAATTTISVSRTP